MKFKDALQQAGILGWIEKLSELVYYYDQDKTKGAMAYWEDPTAMGVMVAAFSIMVAKAFGHSIPSDMQVSIVGAVVALAQLMSKARGVESIKGRKISRK